MKLPLRPRKQNSTENTSLRDSSRVATLFLELRRTDIGVVQRKLVPVGAAGRKIEEERKGGKEVGRMSEGLEENTYVDIGIGVCRCDRFLEGRWRYTVPEDEKRDAGKRYCTSGGLEERYIEERKRVMFSTRTTLV